MRSPLKRVTRTTPNAPAEMEIGSLEWRQLIVDGARQLNIPLHPGHAEQFAVHALELSRWNRKMNLTAIKAPLEVAVKHYLDSIIPAAFIKTGSCLLDVGSGGGFPGIPLKILMPSLSLTMIDATRKKVSFLNHAIRLLNLKDTQAVQMRLEQAAAKDRYRKAFDVIICRGFSSLSQIAVNALPLVKQDGMLIALKAKEAERELRQMKLMEDGTFRLQLDRKKGTYAVLSVKVVKWKLPHLNEDRVVVILRRLMNDSA